MILHAGHLCSEPDTPASERRPPGQHDSSVHYWRSHQVRTYIVFVFHYNCHFRRNYRCGNLNSVVFNRDTTQVGPRFQNKYLILKQWFLGSTLDQGSKTNISNIGFQVPLLTARSRLDMGEEKIANEIDEYFRFLLFSCTFVTNRDNSIPLWRDQLIYKRNKRMGARVIELLLNNPGGFVFSPASCSHPHFLLFGVPAILKQ